jgi:hypothetical protein
MDCAYFLDPDGTFVAVSYRDKLIQERDTYVQVPVPLRKIMRYCHFGFIALDFDGTIWIFWNMRATFSGNLNLKYEATHIELFRRPARHLHR